MSETIVNAELAAANVEQTKRCRRMAGAVRLLGEVLEGAEPICGALSNDTEEYVLPAELYERVAEWLADFHAAEAEAVEVATETGRG